MIEHVQRIGRHTARVGEHEDTLELTLRGDLAPDEAKVLFDFIAARFAGRSYALVTGDMSGMGRIPAESRRVIFKEATRVPPIRGVAYYRASFAARVINELVIRAYALATGTDIAVHFARDEADARAWLVTRREQIAARPGAA
ncbi:STAS/SEC14 domain-containing protein [Sorangium sp. So ce388]|uniref:STAS/SEC14 domain-containing protein n=1 Tax=Sorangium sp. So ce388 TaxID=3133309 RepID=UPI003F5C44EC